MQEFVIFGFVLLLLLVAYWTMVVYPKQRDYQKRQRYVRTLNTGDEVITYGGIIGKIVDINADQGIAYVEIADGVVIRLISASVLQRYDPEEVSQNAQRGIEKGAMPDR